MLNTEKLTYIGISRDNVNRSIIGFKDDEQIYVVYQKGTEYEWFSQIKIQDIVNNPDSYLFTPYISFLEKL